MAVRAQDREEICEESQGLGGERSIMGLEYLQGRCERGAVLCLCFVLLSYEILPGNC